MKRFIHYIVFAAAALAATSCVEPLNTVIPVQSQDLTITFSCGVMTKADPVPTLGADNENLVKRIDYFIFPYGEDGKVAQDAEYACKGTITTTDADKYARTYTETISHDELAKIFPDGNTKAMVFAVANYVDFYGSNNSLSPNTTIPEDAKTWEALHNLEVGSTFFYDDHTEDFGLFWPHALDPNPENNPEDADDLFFVMAGEAEITLVAAANAAAGDAVVNGVVDPHIFRRSLSGICSVCHDNPCRTDSHHSRQHHSQPELPYPAHFSTHFFILSAFRLISTPVSDYIIVGKRTGKDKAGLVQNAFLARLSRVSFGTGTGSDAVYALNGYFLSGMLELTKMTWVSA